MLKVKNIRPITFKVSRPLPQMSGLCGATKMTTFRVSQYKSANQISILKIKVFFNYANIS